MNGILNILAILIFPSGIFLLLNGLAYEWVDRKMLARLQNRVGPRWFQPVADVVKLLVKEEVLPRDTNHSLFILLTIIAVAGIRADGSVADPAVRSASDKVLEEAALEAVRQWRYQPIPAAQPHAVQLVFKFRE